MRDKSSMNRRNFMKNSAFGVVGAGVFRQIPLLQSKEEEKKKKKTANIKEYRTLGRTGFKVSDISTGGISNPALLNALLDAGVNYIDTAESYGRGMSEKAVGEAIKGRDRKSIFITTKLILKARLPRKIPPEDVTKEGIIRRFRKCLERLQTEYVDCLMIHAADDVKSIQSEAYHAAAGELKTEGRLKYTGISHHGSHFFWDPKESMEKVLLAGAEDGRFDVFLLAYNFLKQDGSEKILKICNEKKIGTTLMKTNPVGSYYMINDRIEKQKEEGKKVPEWATKMLERVRTKFDQAESFIKQYDLNNPDEIQDAAIRFVLSNQHVNTVCIGFKNFNAINTYVGLSGTRLTPADVKTLAAYSNTYGNFYCRHACGLCEPRCPHDVPVNTIMRYNHYFDSQGREKYAIEKYAELGSLKANLCQSCEGYCEAACPYHVPIHGLLLLAHRNLTLA